MNLNHPTRTLSLRGWAKCSIDGGTANAHAISEGPLPLAFNSRYLWGIDRHWTPFVYARGLRFGDSLQLALSSQVRL